MNTVLNRSARLRPGYDCKANPCGKGGCGTIPGTSHGMHCHDWIYAVHAKRACLSLVIFSGHFLNAAAERTMREETVWPMPAQLEFCARYAAPEGSGYAIVLGHADAMDCPALGRCYPHASWGLRARDVWEECGGRATFDQSESFWKAFEGIFFRIVEERNIVLEGSG